MVTINILSKIYETCTRATMPEKILTKVKNQPELDQNRKTDICFHVISDHYCWKVVSDPIQF